MPNTAEIKKIVWLASWYPTEIDQLTGDFIMRQAQAFSLFNPVTVIHVQKSNRHIKSETITINDAAFPNLTQIIRYYTVPQLGWVGRLYSYLYSLWLYRCLIKKYIQQHGRPNVLHVHVLLRCGLVALYYKWGHKIPYVVTEHSGDYLPAAKGYVKGITRLNYLLLKLVLKNASAFLPVSMALANALKAKFAVPPVTVIPNVVNTNIFYPTPTPAPCSPPVFLHVSTLSAPKNIEGMLQAFAILKNIYKAAFKLRIVGPPADYYRLLSQQLGIGDNIEWLGETTQQNIAILLNRSTAFVLFSRFETFGCLNIEAIACGVPIIVSDIPTFKEYLQNLIAVHFAATEDAVDLAKVLYDFIISNKKYDKTAIATQAKQFNYQTVGKRIADVYNAI